MDAFVKESTTQLESMRLQVLHEIEEEHQKKLEELTKFYQDLKDQRSVCSSTDDLRDEIQKLRRHIFLTKLFDKLSEQEEYGSGLTTAQYNKSAHFQAELEELEQDLDLDPVPHIDDIE